MDMVKLLIQELMWMIGYPYLRIKQKVLYLNGAHPINDDDMWESSWRGKDLEIIVVKEYKELTTLEGMNKECYTSSLLNILNATSEHFDMVFSPSKELKDNIHKYVISNIQL